MLITLRSLLRRPRRTLLTIAGVALGAATYMALVAAGRGLLAQFSESAKILGAEVVVQQAGTNTPWNSVVPPQVPDRLASIPGVVGGARMILGKTRFLDASYFLVFGVATDDPMLSRLRIVDGGPIDPAADRAQMLVGSWAARRFNLAAGHLIETRHLGFEVAGVYESGRAVLDSGAIVDLPAAQKMFNTGDGSNLVFVDLEAAGDAQAAAEQIDQLLPEVEAHLTSDWVESYGQVAVIRTFARFLALIALVIAMLGVSNVLYITVSERTTELAILRAIGWSRWRVGSLVLLEGVALSALGELCGIPLAAAVLFAVGAIDFSGFTASGLISLALPLDAAFEGVVVCVLAGALGSLFPFPRGSPPAAGTNAAVVVSRRRQAPRRLDTSPADLC